jgi:hypothetical protein
MIDGRLASEELVIAGIVGVLREVSALNRSRPTAHDCDESNAWTYHVEGAAAELAVAKHIDRYWRPLTRSQLRDLPGDVADVQVRSTPRSDGSLIVHRRDLDDARFYLVVTALPSYRIVGWLLGRDAKQERYWRTNVAHPAYFVPQSELHAIERRGGRIA